MAIKQLGELQGAQESGIFGAKSPLPEKTCMVLVEASLGAGEGRIAASSEYYQGS